MVVSKLQGMDDGPSPMIAVAAQFTEIIETL